MKRATIGARLRACASLVRRGAVLADVGTDHAYLPIYLFDEGLIERAVLSDINEGPLAVALQNINECGYRDRVSLSLSDGAASLKDSGATDYAICGMGGELIADIVDRAPHLKDRGIRLVLQPMSRAAHLREYLFDSGFSILREVYSTDEGKHYLTILAEYIGERVGFTEAEAYLGKEGCAETSPALYEYMTGAYRSLMKIRDGKERGGSDASYERALLAEIEKRYDIRRYL